MSGLRLVHIETTACEPWELRPNRKEHPRGGHCYDCGRDIAVFREQLGFRTLCVYCALTDGTLPLVEIEPDDPRNLHDIVTAQRGQSE